MKKFEKISANENEIMYKLTMFANSHQLMNWGFFPRVNGDSSYKLWVEFDEVYVKEALPESKAKKNGRAEALKKAREAKAKAKAELQAKLAEME